MTTLKFIATAILVTVMLTGMLPIARADRQELQTQIAGIDKELGEFQTKAMQDPDFQATQLAMQEATTKYNKAVADCAGLAEAQVAVNAA